jgi:hypothetical protein
MGESSIGSASDGRPGISVPRGFGALAGVRSVMSGWDGIHFEGVMDRLRIMRGSAVRVLARVAVPFVLAITLGLGLAGPGLAATEAPPAGSSGNTTLLVAGLIGGAIAAVWLLKPSARRRPGTGSSEKMADTEAPDSHIPEDADSERRASS